MRTNLRLMDSNRGPNMLGKEQVTKTSMRKNATTPTRQTSKSSANSKKNSNGKSCLFRSFFLPLSLRLCSSKRGKI